MRAIRLTAPRTMESIEIPKPSPDAGEALIRLTEIAICGSDMGFYLDTYGIKFPGKIGFPAHECVGFVEHSEIDEFSVGDRVLWFPRHQDGLQQYVIAHGPEQLLKLPSDGPISRWMMAQLLGTVIHALRELGDIMSERIVVIGQGPVGQLFNHMLWNLGAKMVIAVDRIPERLTVSRAMRATHTVLVGRPPVEYREQLVERVREITGHPGADVVVEASGYDETIRMAIDCVRRDGRVLQFGQPKHTEQQFSMWDVYQKRLHLVSTTGPERGRDYSMALDYIREGRINVDPIITHRFPLDRVQDAYELFAERKDGCVKVIVQLD